MLKVGKIVGCDEGSLLGVGERGEFVGLAVGEHVGATVGEKLGAPRPTLTDGSLMLHAANESPSLVINPDKMIFSSALYFT
jgi:hypothetical protein